MELGGPAGHTQTYTHARNMLNGSTTCHAMVSGQTRHLALDAAQVDHAKVAGQDGLERGEGLQRRDAASFRNYRQRQDVVVQEGAGHVTENGGEAGRCAVHHLWGVEADLVTRTSMAIGRFLIFAPRGDTNCGKCLLLVPTPVSITPSHLSGSNMMF